MLMFLSEVIIYAEVMGRAPVYELDSRQFCNFAQRLPANTMLAKCKVI